MFLPCSSNGVRFGVEDDFVEVQSMWRSEKQVEVFESFSEQETLH
jgi:hypothetical protein